MRSVLKSAAAIGALLLAPVPALAGDVALLLSNTDYPDRSAPRAAAAADALAQRLRQRGFEVSRITNAAAAEAWEGVRRFAGTLDAADRVLVLVQGDIVSAGPEAWLVARYAQSPDALAIGGHGVALGALLRMLEDKQGEAVMLVASLPDAPAPGDGLAAGLGALPVPQGVSLLSGRWDDLLPIVADELLQPGRSVGAFLATAPKAVEGRGFVPRGVPFLPRGQGDEGLTERDFWRTVDILGTEDAYRGYLERYPGGAFAALARQRLAELETSRGDAAQAGEEALGLALEQRRAIQRDLSVLGYDTGGIDGIFGRSTRASIAAWQRENREEATSYLTVGQITRLRQQAAERNRVLQEEARARRAQLERDDRAYWARTGAAGTEAGLLDYLARYPDGLFAEQANRQLTEIERRKREEARAADRAAWDRATAADTRAAYRRYLQEYPEGAFAEQARNRIDALDRAEVDREAVEAARQQEALLTGLPPLRLAVERGLAAQGYEPGPQDGTFDARTRRALRQFQRANGLTVTGYADRATMVRLLAGQAQQ
ncbi:peptidoglycan-binding protein [Actibacterium sp. MT2.3-13A]|uniref:peptidoglycan-binding domain-containing protein n=1 Tax=Actibacterium sp. MT2.3-13A TaxID=2828332 RepID=UPI001BA7C7FD|nr:peptidoglycan-binding protein [Actibacterium sp. MT2.3-13A]